jgi:arsenate reductase-like glutaredoxin family protein
MLVELDRKELEKLINQLKNDVNQLRELRAEEYELWGQLALKQDLANRNLQEQLVVLKKKLRKYQKGKTSYRQLRVGDRR